MRWNIEQFWRLLKLQGLRLEGNQLETAERLMKLTAIAVKAATITFNSSRLATAPAPILIVQGPSSGDRVEQLVAAVGEDVPQLGERVAELHQ
jgi:hypothetical protein